jgi:hypothetical protein
MGGVLALLNQTKRKTDQVAEQNVADNLASLPLLYSFASHELITTSGTFTAPKSGFYTFLLIGGGGGGAVCVEWDYEYSTTSGNLAAGGGSGKTAFATVWLDAGQDVPISVGAAGVGSTLDMATTNMNEFTHTNGTPGGTTTATFEFVTLTADGGPGGTANQTSGSIDSGSNWFGDAVSISHALYSSGTISGYSPPANFSTISTSEQGVSAHIPTTIIDSFVSLGSGGPGGRTSDNDERGIGGGGGAGIDGNGGSGVAIRSSTSSISATNGTGYGSGGGGAVKMTGSNTTNEGTATSGNGTDGAALVMWR